MSLLKLCLFTLAATLAGSAKVGMLNLRSPAEGDQHSWVIPITIPA